MKKYETLAPERWAEYLNSQPETGMGYYIATCTLKSGEKFERVAIVGGVVAQVFGYDSVPFSADDIEEIEITHDKWDFNEGAQ